MRLLRSAAKARDTRRRVGVQALVPAGNDPAETQAVVERLAEARLVVIAPNEITGEQEIEVAHEALIQYWGRLRDWLNENRDALRVREGVRRAALEWEQNQQQAAYLVHRGERLENARALTRHPRVTVNEREQSYIDACTALRLEELIGELRSAVRENAPVDRWLQQLGDAGGTRLVRQLEAPDTDEPAQPDSESTLDKFASLLGTNEVPSPDRSEDGTRKLGPIAQTAVLHPDSITRQTAALVLTLLDAGPDMVVGRLGSALQAELQGGPRRWRRAQLRGVLADADPEIEKLNAELPPADRFSVWLWRVGRRVVRDRHRIAGLTEGGGVGAGLALASLRALIAIPTTNRAGAIFGIFLFYAGILGAVLTLGMALADPLLLRRSEGTGDAPAIWRAPLHPDRLPAIVAVGLGTVFFGIAHTVVAVLHGIHLSVAALLVPLGFVAGLGLSLALYAQPGAGWRLGVGRWPLRLGTAAAAFILTQQVFIVAGNRWANTLAIGWAGSFYKSEFTRYVQAWWPQLVEGDLPWFDYLARADAGLVGIVLTVGITAGLVLAADWLARWQTLVNQAGD